MLRIATRRSALAQAQATQVGQRIAERTGSAFELAPMATTADLEPERAITSFDAKGLFVDRIREAVLAGECDLAVHSAKDLPTDPAPGLVVAAAPPRADPRDVLITRDGYALANLPETATVGTSSERRRLQLLRAKPALQVLPIRGNLDTRLRKVHEGEFEAVVVAAAGLERLYVPEDQGGVGALKLPLKAYVLEPGECLPAPAQGALAVECRADDDNALAACKTIDDLPSRRAVEAERALLAGVGGGCLAAVGALATGDGRGGLELIGFYGDPATRRMLRLSSAGPAHDAARLGAELAQDLVRAMGS